MKYRDHTGSLDESLKTQIDVECEQDIIDHLNKFYNEFGKEVEEIKMSHAGYDDRIGWDTHYVTHRLKGETVFNVAGMTNGTFTNSDRKK